MRDGHGFFASLGDLVITTGLTVTGFFPGPGDLVITGLTSNDFRAILIEA